MEMNFNSENITKTVFCLECLVLIQAPSSHTSVFVDTILVSFIW